MKRPVELLEICFDLPPRQPGGENRVSFIKVLKPDDSIRELTFAEPLNRTRTVRDDYILQDDETPRPSSWIDAIRGLIRNFGFHQTRNYKEVLARSQFSCFDTTTGLPESRKLDIFSVVPNNQSRFTEETEFNPKGHPFRHSIVWCGPSGQARYHKEEWFGWETGTLVETQECYPLAPDWSASLITKTFAPETGKVVQEQRWTRIKKGSYLDTNSGRVITRTHPLKPSFSILSNN